MSRPLATPLLHPTLEIGDDEFDRLRRTILDAAGIALNDSKRALVATRLGRRVLALGLRDFAAYCDYLDRLDPHGEERQRLLNCITTNQTGFFREPHHFEFLRTVWLPRVLARRAQGAPPRLRVWSAGCSTGEEAYSIAMTLADALPEPDRWDVRILATDIDTEVLDVARAGIYPAERIAALPVAMRRSHFQRGRGAWEGSVRVRASRRQWVAFRSLNLIAPRWPMTRPFDLVFCRNVIIYFDRPTQQRVSERLVAQMAADGVLCIGHSETLVDLRDLVEPIAPTIYQRRVGGAS